MSIPCSRSKRKNEEKDILHVRNVVAVRKNQDSGNGPTRREEQKRSDDLNASTLNAEHFFPSRAREKQIFEPVSDTEQSVRTGNGSGRAPGTR